MALSRSIILRVTGQPKPEPRSRASIRGLHAGIHRPGTAASWERCVTLEAEKFRPVQMIEGPVRLDIIVIIERPKLHESARGGLKKSAPIYFNTKGRGIHGGDWDNFGKLICDTLTDCAYWKDDGQVWGSCRKRWADLDEAHGALVVVTPVEDREPGGWLSELDRKMRRAAIKEPPAARQVIPAEPKRPSQYRKFTDAWCSKWMAKYMARYPFAGARDAAAATRIWDACGHDLQFAERVMTTFLADDQDFYKGHTLAMLSAGGVLPKFLAEARAVKRAKHQSTQNLYKDGKIV